jgi:hypothetical protein
MLLGCDRLTEDNEPHQNKNRIRQFGGSSRGSRMRYDTNGALRFVMSIGMLVRSKCIRRQQRQQQAQQRYLLQA